MTMTCNRCDVMNNLYNRRVNSYVLLNSITLKIRMLCFFPKNSILVNHLCVGILFQNANSHCCFRMLTVIVVSDFSNATTGAQTAVLWPFSATRLLKLAVENMCME